MLVIPQQTVTVHRRQAGTWGDDGIWIPGAETETTIQASVQPASPQDLQKLPEGRRQARAYRLFTIDPIYAASDQNPDRVELYDQIYEVQAVESWQNQILSHYSALVTLIDDQT